MIFPLPRLPDIPLHPSPHGVKSETFDLQQILSPQPCRVRVYLLQHRCTRFSAAVPNRHRIEKSLLLTTLWWGKGGAQQENGSPNQFCAHKSMTSTDSLPALGILHDKFGSKRHDVIRDLIAVGLVGRFDILDSLASLNIRGAGEDENRFPFALRSSRAGYA